ncbi:hypothetical protein BASA81_010602 [Batrachochytrium salamandrivorans]|nr:hypothetical protein BASA81_010602 [Batrachochytrium salamandrivorans]
MKRVQLTPASPPPPPRGRGREEEASTPDETAGEAPLAAEEEEWEVLFLKRVLAGQSVEEAREGLEGVRVNDLMSALHWTGLELSRQFSLESANVACDVSESQARGGIDDTIAQRGDLLFVSQIATLVPSVSMTLSCPSALHVDVRSSSLTVTSAGGVPIQVKQRQGEELVLL